MPSPHSAQMARGALYPGRSSGATAHTHPLDIEQLLVGHFPVGAHLLLILVFDLRIHLARAAAGRFPCRHADRTVFAQIAERRRDLAEIAKLERALAQPAARHDRDGVGGASIDLDEGDQPLAIGARRVAAAPAGGLRTAPCAAPGSGRRRGVREPVRQALRIRPSISRQGSRCFHYRPERANAASPQISNPGSDTRRGIARRERQCRVW